MSARSGLGSFVLLMLLWEPVAAQERVTFFLNDAFASPVVALDNTGTVVWRGDYDPFGSLVNTTGTVITTRQYRATYSDVESGLLLMGRRYYLPGIGRFITPDAGLLGMLPTSTLASPSRLNAYAYALNNPYRFEDPSGAYSVESESLKRSKEFNQAARLVARTREGARLLWALDFSNANIAVYDELDPYNDFARKFPRLASQIRGGMEIPMSIGDVDYMISIDYSIYRSTFKNPKLRLRRLAEALYHELRHVEIDVETYTSDLEANRNLHDAIDRYATPSWDHRERAFKAELQRLMRNPGRGRL